MKKTSNLHDKSEYHSDVTVTAIKDNVTKNYVLFRSITISIHFETRKLAGQKLRYSKKRFFLFRKMKKRCSAGDERVKWKRSGAADREDHAILSRCCCRLSITERWCQNRSRKHEKKERRHTHYYDWDTATCSPAMRTPLPLPRAYSAGGTSCDLQRDPISSTPLRLRPWVSESSLASPRKFCRAFGRSLLHTVPRVGCVKNDEVC